MAEETQPEEKSKDEKPKYDEKIKSTKDVLKEKLQDKKVEYGQGHNFDKYAQELLVDSPKRSNDLTIDLNAEIYASLKKNKAISNVKEVGKAADEMYDITSKVVLETIGFGGFKPKNKDGEAELEDLVKSYMGNLDRKTLKRGLEERYKQVGYLDEKIDTIQRNILNYPVTTFARKKEQRVIGEIEEITNTKEGFDEFKKEIKSLAEKLNKPVTDEEIFIPNKALDTWIKLKNIQKTLQTL